jgi:hypothetical protein
MIVLAIGDTLLSGGSSKSLPQPRPLHHANRWKIGFILPSSGTGTDP